MKNKAFFTEKAKDLLIILLLISAVVLAVKSGYYSALTDTIGGGFLRESGETYQPQPGREGENPELAMPDAVMVNRGGSFFASVYSRDATEEGFGLFSAYFSEALGSAGEPESISGEDFRARLESGSAAFCYDEPRQLDMLGSWLSTDMTSPAKVYESGLIVLCLDEGGVKLCFSTNKDGFFQCVTATSAEMLSARIASFSGAKAGFAYSSELFSGCSEYLVVPESLPDICCVNVCDPVSAGMNTAALMDAVGLNSRMATSYRETDGTTVYIEGSKTLRIDSAGRMSFNAAEVPDTYADIGRAGAVGLAQSLISKCAESVGGDARVEYCGAGYDESRREYTVSFRYEINGIPVESELGAQGEVKVQNGVVTEIEMLLRRYELAEGTEELLPAVQAFAVASAAGRDPALVYADYGESVRCVWVNN